VLGTYVLMSGDYDMAFIFELPSDEAAFAGALATQAMGNARGTMTRAFTVDEFTQIVKKMP